MESIPQRELRNQSGRILRAAEAGAEYVVTVDGRPAAQIGPVRSRTWVGADAVRRLLASATDEGVLADLARVPTADTDDPWQGADGPTA